jgi:hypothetical protein
MPIGAIIGGRSHHRWRRRCFGARCRRRRRRKQRRPLQTAPKHDGRQQPAFRETRALRTSQIAQPVLQQRSCGWERLAGAAPRLSAFSRIYGRNAGWSGIGGNGALDAYLAANPDVAQEARRVTADHEFSSPEEYAAVALSALRSGEGRAAPALNTPAQPAASGAATGALNPWDQFRNSTNYQWRLIKA